jgi:hypothetical protein
MARISIHSLISPNLEAGQRELLDEADVITGVDMKTGHNCASRTQRRGIRVVNEARPARPGREPLTIEDAD